MAWAVSSISPTWPGTVETPALAANFFDSILSPMASMALGLGPMKTIPSLASRRATPAFSDRKPKPGWTASAPVWRTASTILSATR